MLAAFATRGLAFRRLTKQAAWFASSGSSSGGGGSSSSGGGGSSSSSGSSHRRQESGAGLFGIPRLQAPADFGAWAAEAQARCDELVAAVLAAPPDATAVRLVDDISDTMCQVYDSAECARSVHSDPAWRRAASMACQALGEYLARINHHEGLYSKLVAVQAAYEASSAAVPGSDRQQPHALAVLSRAQLAAFCPETLMVAAKYRLDFEKYGIHLQHQQQRAEAARLLALNQHFPARFNAALADPQQLGSVSIPSKLLPPGLRLYSLGVSFRLPLDSGSVHGFLGGVANEDARKQAYLAHAASPAANVRLLEDMLAARHAMAQLLGFDSYARFKAADGTLAGTPDAASSFCRALADDCRSQADAELQRLTQLKRQETGSPGAVLQPWDQAYFTAQLTARSPHHVAAAAAAPYLQLHSVLRGLSELMHRLLGVQLEQQPLAAGEAWAPGLLKLRVVCREQGPLGTLFLDLLARPGKVPSNGILYPLRCGRQLPGGGYQQPLLCLVGNLSCSASCEQLLTWREFRTLVHECGHAVHCMVSRTRYQHLWGTRCSQDVVEVPSHLWEHFCTDQRSLALLARHHSSGESLPASLAQQLSHSSSVTPALELQQQALLSLVDLVYHGPQLPSKAGGTSEVWADLAAAHSSLPTPRGTSPQARFSHLTIYGASYYSYLYARCLSEAVWQAHLAADPFDPDAGCLVRRLLLEPGGSVEPLTLISAALGGAETRNTVLQQRAGGWAPHPDLLLRSIHL